MYPRVLVTIISALLLFACTQAAPSQPSVAKRQGAVGTAVSTIPSPEDGFAEFSPPYYCILGQTIDLFWSQQCCNSWCCNFNDLVFDDLYWALSNSAALPVPEAYWIWTGSDCTGVAAQIPWDNYQNVSYAEWRSMSQFGPWS